MSPRILVLVVLAVCTASTACTKEESAAEQSSAAREKAAARQASAARGALATACDENASVQVDLSGNWIYGNVPGKGAGTTQIQQTGSCVRMTAAWTPQGKGPHFSIEGVIEGRTIDTRWRSLSGEATGTISFKISQNGNAMSAIRATGGRGFEGLHWTRK